MKISLSESSRKITLIQILSLGALATGVYGRWVVSGLGNNLDFVAWQEIARLTQHGQNIYANTINYNYGPIWFSILSFFSKIAHHTPTHPDIFRSLIVGLLIIVDVSIFTILYYRFRWIAAVLFILNPISIIISGYHNQFDNIAILFALLAMILYEHKNPRTKIGGLVLLGISLSTKHIFFIFPFWLAFKAKGAVQKILTIFIPFSIFVLGFLPYWSEGKAGIIKNVFGYRSFDNYPFYHMFVPLIVQYFLTPINLFVLALLFFGWYFRKIKPLESVLLYTIPVVIFASALTNQYLVIPIVALSVFINPGYIPYLIMASLYLLADSDGLHIASIHQALPPAFLTSEVGIKRVFDWLVVLLFAGFIAQLNWPRIQVFTQQLRSTVKKI